MFVKTIKLKRTAGILLAVLVVMLITLVVLHFVNSGLTPKGVMLESEDAQVKFLRDLGWETSPEPIDCRSVIIPEEWNDTYSDYNALQLAQGFDLEGYKGVAVEIYTYEIYNYGSSMRPNVIANLIILDGKLIGGDVCCTELGGFMQGLLKETV